MAILFELSEPMIKRAALISAKFPDRSLLSIIEECFNYGATSLYADSPNPVQDNSSSVRRMVTETYKNPVPPEPGYLESLSEITGSMAEQARNSLESLNRPEVIHSDSYTDPIIGSNGMYEL